MLDTLSERTPADSERGALDAYSEVVTRVAAELTPRVAALHLSRQRPDGGVEASAGSAVVFTDDGFLLGLDDSREQNQDDQQAKVGTSCHRCLQQLIFLPHGTVPAEPFQEPAFTERSNPGGRTEQNSFAGRASSLHPMLLPYFFPDRR